MDLSLIQKETKVLSIATVEPDPEDDLLNVMDYKHRQTRIRIQNQSEKEYSKSRGAWKGQSHCVLSLDRTGPDLSVRYALGKKGGSEDQKVTPAWFN